MMHLIPSDVTLTETGLRFKTADKYEEINYRTIIWVYIRKRQKPGNYSLYLLEHITADTSGELVVVDENKNVYLFLEEDLSRPAGELLIDMMDYDNACFAGYSGLYRKLYHTDFEEMKKYCSILREIK